MKLWSFRLSSAALFVSIFLSAPTVFAQHEDDTSSESGAGEEPIAQQDDVSKALDSTATQWSFQVTYQWSTWKDDIVHGELRAPGLDSFVQLRVVAPLV